MVVGGGIAGLAAALDLAGAGFAVTLLEGAAQVGGKLRVSELAGLPVDEGAESVLRRAPEALELATAVGLTDVVTPATTSASVLRRGRLRPLPAGTLLGVPTDLAALARSGLLTPAELVRAAADRVLPGRLPGEGEDVAIGALVRARLGSAVVDRLVDPLLGGVYAGRADGLSLRATVPALAAAAVGRRSLLAAARAARAAAPAPAGPVFASFAGGLGRLPVAVAAALTRAGVHAAHRCHGAGGGAGRRRVAGRRRADHGAGGGAGRRGAARRTGASGGAAARRRRPGRRRRPRRHRVRERRRGVAGPARGRHRPAGGQRLPRARRRGPAGQGGHPGGAQVGGGRRGRPGARGGAGVGGPVRRRARPRPRRRRPGAGRRGRRGAAARAHRGAGRRAGEPVGRGAAAVRARAPRSGGADPGGAAGDGGGRGGGVRRGGRARLRPHRPTGGRATPARADRRPARWGPLAARAPEGRMGA